MRVRSDLELFNQQKRHAASRGIEFEFSLAQWVEWWRLHLGDDWKARRGRRRGQYVMARNGDHGPYSPSNVKCITCEQNQSEQQVNGTAGSGWNKGARGLPKKGNKLSAADVLAIYHAQGTQKAIAARFGVNQSCVSLIKCKRIWAHLTVGGEACAS